MRVSCSKVHLHPGACQKVGQARGCLMPFDGILKRSCTGFDPRADALLSLCSETDFPDANLTVLHRSTPFCATWTPTSTRLAPRCGDYAASGFMPHRRGSALFRMRNNGELRDLAPRCAIHALKPLDAPSMHRCGRPRPVAPSVPVLAQRHFRGPPSAWNQPGPCALRRSFGWRGSRPAVPASSGFPGSRPPAATTGRHKRPLSGVQIKSGLS